jgi:hypothetical protein
LCSSEDSAVRLCSCLSLSELFVVSSYKPWADHQAAPNATARAVDPTYFETDKEYRAKERAVADPTTLILVDEADRLQMNSLEQMRSIFDGDRP